MPVDHKVLDDYVEAFEQAWRSQGFADPRSYLPAREDEMYMRVLRELLRIDLELGWESNRPRRLEDYRTGFPELFADRESLGEVAFEEYRLRRQAGESPSPEEYSRQYGIATDDWPPSSDASSSLEASIQLEQGTSPYDVFPVESADQDSIRLSSWQGSCGIEPELVRLVRELGCLDDEGLANSIAQGMTRLPAVGGEFLGFELVAELGRGAFGRVFLARQAALADRLVAVKIAPDVGSESQALAQLQQTHIVPIYSVHRAEQLQAVCMPYCGHVTIADVLRDLREGPNLPREGLQLLRTLPLKERPQGIERSTGLSKAVAGTLGSLSYSMAVLWLGGRLAEGLEHAHQRGILHRDIKPANILLTDEGLPMLLDFNVAEDVKKSRAGLAVLGGTLPYMAPEQLEAFLGGKQRVDARSDVYSLGIVLYELMTGVFPFPSLRQQDLHLKGMEAVLQTALQDRHKPICCPRVLNRNISPTTAAIVMHCLEADPSRRYPSARALQEDIECHLRDEPLRHLREPSLRERMQKWLRRHPRFYLQASISAVVLLAVLASYLGYRGAKLQQARRAQEVLNCFRQDYLEGQFLLQVLAASAQERQQGEQACLRALDRYDVLQDPHWRRQGWVRSLPVEEQQRLQGEVGELCLLLARQTQESATTSEQLEQAQCLLDRAEECFSPGDAPGILWKQRARLWDRLGNPREAERAECAAGRTPPQSTRDRYLQARELAWQGRYGDAEKLLQGIVAEQPDSYAALFLLGLCLEGMGKEVQASRCYTACIALAPWFYGPYVQRGLLALRSKDYPAAKMDFDRVIHLMPDRAETYLDRATARQWLGERREAVADLNLALEKGLAATRVHFFRARLKRQLGDEAGAKQDHEQGLRLTPTDERSWIARGFARMQEEPGAALADFEQALKLNPASQAALMNKAHVLAEILGKQEEARTTLERVLSLYPEHVPALAGQAVVLARLRKRELAHEHMTRALERDRSGLTLYQAACVYALTSRLKADDADLALLHLRKALDARFGLGLLEKDPDLAPLAGHPGFKRLLQLARMLRQDLR